MEMANAEDGAGVNDGVDPRKDSRDAIRTKTACSIQASLSPQPSTGALVCDM